MILSGILSLAFVFRLISINQSLWLDEAINVLAVKNFGFFQMLTTYAQADFHPPGYFIILWVWTRLFGYSEIAVRAPSIIFSLLTVYLVYLIGKKVFSKNVGLTAALLLAVNPLHIYYSQEARMYALAAFSSAISFFIFIKLVKEEKINIYFLIASNLLVLLSDYVAYLIFPAQLLFLIVAKKNITLFKRWLLSFIASVLIMVIWLPVFINQLNIGIATSMNIPGWKEIVGSSSLKALALTFVKFIIGRFTIQDKNIYALFFTPVGLIFGYLIYKGVKASDLFSKRLLILWIATPIILGILISFITPVYSYSRVLFLIVPFIILISIGLCSLDIRIKKVFFLAVFIIEIFCSTAYLTNPVFQREDWKGLNNFMSNVSGGTKILLESNGLFPPLEYYSKYNESILPALANFPAKGIGDVKDLNEIKFANDVYLVEYLVDVSDPNRLVDKRLEILGFKKREILNFNGVGFVYHYIK